MLRTPSLPAPRRRSPARIRLPRAIAAIGSRRGACVAALVAIALLAAPGRAPAMPAGVQAPFVELTLRVRDTAGGPLEARARVQGSDNASYPRVPEPDLLANDGAGGYFYVDGEAHLFVPVGATRITVGRGFEWVPADTTITLGGDSVVTVALARFAQPGDDGWWSGDMHVHMQHPPLQYAVTPAIAMRVARAEGLSVMHLLDEAYEFTGAPHLLSDSANVLYFSYEFRNQTWGHVSLPGLQSPFDDECCLAPGSPLPMNTDAADAVAAGAGGLFVLAHPRTTRDSTQFCCWPGAGLGRELPVLAALGRLSAMELASYSNDPDLDTDDWFDLLSVGLGPVPVAGTDAVLNWNNQPPAGGWRVYARLPRGVPFDYDAWLESVRAGRTFVTSHPLIPEFAVNGAGPGESLEAAGDTLEATVSLSALSALSIRRIALIADGVEIWSRPWTTWPPIVRKDTTLTLRMPTPAWMALRVEGPIGHPHAVSRPPVAITNAVRFTQGGVPRRVPARAQRWLSELDALEDVIEARGGWAAPAERDTVLARIARARAVYEALALPPVLASPGPPHAAPRVARAWPNPSFGPVRLEGFGGPVDVFDASGRRVARVTGDAPAWDGRDGSAPARPGLYLARSADGRVRARIVRLR